MSSISRPTRSADGTPRGPRIGVLVVDDHPAVRSGVTRLLGDQPDLTVIAEASTAITAVDAATPDVEVAVVDYHLGDRTGLWVVRRLSQLTSPPKILIYSAFSDDALAVAATVAGAEGLLSKAAIGEELCLAVRRLAAGGQYLPAISAPVARAMSARVDLRLRPIFAGLTQDIPAAQIQAALRISSAELDTARDAILAMLAPASRGRWRATAPVALDYDRTRRRWRSAAQPSDRNEAT
ncbi:MAG: response regulator [Solirubrobacteraceae bacterium]